MAKVNYRSQFAYGFAGQPVSLRARVSIGAAGAPTLIANTGMGIDSVVRNGAGDYTLNLSQAFFELMDASVAIISGASAPAAPLMNIRTNSASVAAAPLVRIQMRDLTGTATDPASGEILLIVLELNRSSTGC